MMGHAARSNVLSFEGKPEATAEFARLKTMPLSELVALWCRLMWKKVHRG